MTTTLTEAAIKHFQPDLTV